jgi:peptidoglycan hydrolase-like protein with peptidoglycan-binding domain
MAEFTAPLFLGDDFLLQCLNGTATMGDRAQDQAPPESVHRVQTALQRLGYDLGVAGVDDRWGPATYQAVLAFKTALDIRAPDGTLDGYVGPKTMTALENIFGVAAFDAVAASVVDIGARTAGQSDYGDGIYTVPYEQGLVVASPQTFRWPIPAPLSDVWADAGGPWG